jgi:hypothetical protein
MMRVSACLVPSPSRFGRFAGQIEDKFEMWPTVAVELPCLLPGQSQRSVGAHYSRTTSSSPPLV